MGYIKKLFNNYIIGFGSVASIIALLVIIFSDSWSTIIALSVICLLFILLFVRAIYVLNKFIDQENPNPYSKRSSFIKYEAIDKENINYHIYRLIQSKNLALTKVEHKFDWTGDNYPEIESSLQDVEEIIKRGRDNYDKVILKLKKPLWYNETAVVHFNAKCFDPNQNSSPYVNMKVTTHIDMIHFRVVLKYVDANFGKNAQIYKKPFNSELSGSFEPVESVSFDKETKSYEHVLLNPDVGFYYKIEWERE